MADGVGNVGTDNTRINRTAAASEASPKTSCTAPDPSPPASAPEPSRAPASEDVKQSSRTLSAASARPTEARVQSELPARAAPQTASDQKADAMDAVTSNIKRGDRGDDVESLQRALNANGAALTVDGKFGPLTESALKDFQGTRGLARDGVAGARTREAFKAASRASSSAPSSSRTRLEQTRAPETLGAPKAGTVDVSHVTAHELERMKSGSQVERDKAQAVERARTAFADTIKAGGRVLVGSSAGNGNKPVVTVVPPGFDPQKAARVETHYHGWNATTGDAKGHSSGTTARIEEIQKKNPQAVFVLPECSNPRAGNYKADWSNVTNQAQTTRDAMNAAGITNIGARIVSAHSAGGQALQRAMQAKADGSGVQADRLELQDCLYGQEGPIAQWAKTPSGRAIKDALYFRGTNGAGRDAGIARAFGDKFRRIDVSAARDVPFIAGTRIRKYAGDAHDRTVADFMDSVPGP